MWKYALKEVNKHKIISQGNYFEVLKQDDMKETGMGTIFQKQPSEKFFVFVFVFLAFFWYFYLFFIFLLLLFF